MFNLAAKMGPDGKQPYNGFLQQATNINQAGVPFMPAADLALTDGNGGAEDVKFL